MRNFDEGMIEPEVNFFYHYNMKDSTVKKGKGNYIVQAQGYAYYQNRVERLNSLTQIISLVLSNEQFVKESKLDEMLSETFRAMDLDGTHFLKSEAEKEDEAKQETAAQQAEQQKADAAMQLEMQAKQLEIASMQSRMQRETELAKSEMALNDAKIADLANKKKLDTAKLILDAEKAKVGKSANSANNVSQAAPAEAPPVLINQQQGGAPV